MDAGKNLAGRRHNLPGMAFSLASEDAISIDGQTNGTGK